MLQAFPLIYDNTVDVSITEVAALCEPSCGCSSRGCLQPVRVCTRSLQGSFGLPNGRTYTHVHDPFDQGPSLGVIHHMWLQSGHCHTYRRCPVDIWQLRQQGMFQRWAVFKHWCVVQLHTV